MMHTKQDLNKEDLKERLPQEKKKDSLRESFHSSHEDLHRRDENDLSKSG